MVVRLGYQVLAIIAFIAPLVAVFSGVLLTPLLILLAIFSILALIVRKSLFSIHIPLPVKILFLWLIYGLISAVWSIEPTKSITIGIRLLLLFVSGYSVVAFIRCIPDTKCPLFQKYFFSGLVVSILVISFELITNGMLSSLIKSYKSDYMFDPYMLNRGATYLALAAWVGVAMLCIKQRPVIAGLLWLVVLVVLLMMESTSATVGYIGGTLSFGIVLLLRRVGINILLVTMFIGMLAMPVSFSFIDAERLSASFPAIPESAKHRLYIWEFVSKKAMEKPTLGYGLSGSRYYDVKPEDIKVPVFNPLPNHPHNNMLQIWFELGFVGVIFFATMVAVLLIYIRNNAYPYYAKACAVALLVSYGVVGMFSYSIWHNWWIANGLLIMAFLVNAMQISPASLNKTNG